MLCLLLGRCAGPFAAASLLACLAEQRIETAARRCHGIREPCVSGNAACLLQVWSYDNGNCRQLGQGHSGAVTRVAVTHDKTAIISVGTEGAVLIWAYPEKQQQQAST